VADKFPYRYMHECGGIAFLLRRMPEYGEVLRSCDVAHVGGNPMETGLVLCDACGKNVYPRRGNIVANNDD